MMYPLVSIITLNFNHTDVTCALLKSLRQITYPSIEVIVVDNASQQDDPSILSNLFPEILFIRNGENLGFAGGNNIGIRAAKGKYVLLLNNDTEVEAGFLEPLVAKLESNNQLGAVSPKIKFFFERNTIQFSGQSPINTITMRSHGYGWGAKDVGQFDMDKSTAFVHGAATLIPMEVIRKVGLMAEIYFLYYEEFDWCTRIKAAGYELQYVHNSVVFHKVSVSIGKNSALKCYHMNRSRILYLRRNVHGIRFLLACIYLMTVSIPKNIVTYLFKVQTTHCKAYCNAIIWHLKNITIDDLYSNPTLIC